MKAALKRSARLSTGMYWTSILAPLWAASNSVTASLTTADLGSWLTSEKSHTRTVPVRSSEDEAALFEVGGAQDVSARAARAAAAAVRAIFKIPPLEKWDNRL